MKTLAPYVVGFLLLIAAALVRGNWDPITPAGVEARAETSVGVSMMSVIDQSLAFVMKLVLGASVLSVLSFAWLQGSKLYRRWWSEKLTRRGAWRSGPNANFQQQPKLPKLTREDVMLMALTGREPRLRVPRYQAKEERDDEIDLDL
jgi:hypothetical protein